MYPLSLSNCLFCRIISTTHWKPLHRCWRSRSKCVSVLKLFIFERTLNIQSSSMQFQVGKCLTKLPLALILTKANLDDHRWTTAKQLKLTIVSGSINNIQQQHSLFFSKIHDKISSFDCVNFCSEPYIYIHMACFICVCSAVHQYQTKIGAKLDDGHLAVSVIVFASQRRLLLRFAKNECGRSFHCRSNAFEW